MNFSFHPEAEEEFLGAIDYYEEREENLGLDSPWRCTPPLAAQQNTRRLGLSSKVKCADV